MRVRYLVPLALILVAVGFAAARLTASPPAAAQSTSMPLLANEVASWCPRSSSGAISGACDNARYDLMSDGSVHVLLDINPGNREETPAGNCITGIAFPDDVTGVAYVLEGDRYGVLDLNGLRNTSEVCEFIVWRVS